MIAFEAVRPSLFYRPGVLLILLPFFAIGLFLFIKCIIPIKKDYKAAKATGNKEDFSDFILSTALSFVFSTAFLLVSIYSAVVYFSGNIALMKMYKEYKSGECEIVEGTVENFHPMPQELHDTEHFEVEGVYFQYGADNSKHCYSRCKKDGGFITGDGQKVKIWYVSYGGNNYIMQLKLLN